MYCRRRPSHSFGDRQQRIRRQRRLPQQVLHHFQARLGAESHRHGYRPVEPDDGRRRRLRQRVAEGYDASPDGVGRGGGLGVAGRDGRLQAVGSEPPGEHDTI